MRTPEGESAGRAAAPRPSAKPLLEPAQGAHPGVECGDVEPNFLFEIKWMQKVPPSGERRDTQAPEAATHPYGSPPAQPIGVFPGRGFMVRISQKRALLLATLLCVSLAVACQVGPEPGEPIPSGPEWGCDVDGDGMLTANDSEMAFAFVAGIQTPTAFEFNQADVSPIGHPDDVLDMSDVEVIARASTGEQDLCRIANAPPLELNNTPYEWQEPADLGVGDPVFPPGPYIDVTNLPVDCSGCPDAVADGVTNDAVAISLAIQYACQNGISNIYIPPGTYAIGHPQLTWGYSGIGYETYLCPGTVEIFGAGPETVLMPNSPVGNFLFQVCYDWGGDIPEGNANHTGVNCFQEDNVYVPTSRLVLHDMTWRDPDPYYNSSLYVEESHGLKVFPTLGSLEVYNIEVVDIGDEAFDLNMHEDSSTHLHHNEIYGVPSIGGGSAYAIYSGGDIFLENSIIDAQGGDWTSSRFGSCFDLNPNSVAGRRLRNIQIRDNWCRGRKFGAKVALTGADDEPIEWLELENNYIEIVPDRRDMNTQVAAIRLRPNKVGENDAYILGGLIQNNELRGPMRFDTDGIFDVEVRGNSVKPIRATTKQHGVISATATNPVRVTAIHSLADGQQVTFINVSGMTELNGRTFTVTNSQPGGYGGTFELLGENGEGRTPGLYGAIQYEVGAFPVTLAARIISDPPTMRMLVKQDLEVDDVIETSGFEQMPRYNNRRFKLTNATPNYIEFEIDDASDFPSDASPNMEIRLVQDGHGVHLRGRRIEFLNNTVSGFADSCVVVHPMATNTASSCAEGLYHSVDFSISANDFDCDGGQRDESHFIVAKPQFGEICGPDPAVGSRFVVTGNTVLVDEQPSWARGALEIGNAWPGVTVRHNRIYRHSTETDGVGISIAHAPDPDVRDNEVRWAGEGILVQALDGGLVEDNKVELFGTAPYFDSGITLNSVNGATVSQNTVCGNPNAEPDGIEINSGSNNALTGNSAIDAGCFAIP